MYIPVVGLCLVRTSCQKMQKSLVGFKRENMMNVINSFAEKLSIKMIEKGIVKEKDIEICRYGIENCVVIAGNLITALVIGMITGKLGTVVVFLLFYSALRSYSGGIHCKDKFSCWLCSALILFTPIFAFDFIMKVMIEPIRIAIGIAAILIICFLSPVESINKRLDDEERKFFKKISCCIAASQGCILVVLFGLRLYQYFCAGYVSLLLIAFFMVIGKIAARHYV